MCCAAGRLYPSATIFRRRGKARARGRGLPGLTSASSLIAGSVFTIATVVVALHKAALVPAAVGDRCYRAEWLLLHAQVRRHHRRLLWRKQSAYRNSRLPLRSVEALSRVVFIRHAETEMAGRYCGHSDPELNAQGRAQLTKLTHLLSIEPFGTVYSERPAPRHEHGACDCGGQKHPASVAPRTARDEFRRLGRHELGTD